MTETLERLDVPTSTYRELEKIAQFQGVPLSRVLENLVRQFQFSDSLQTLRQEYQMLTDKALRRTITAVEDRRLERVSREISALERQTSQGQHWEQWNKRADELIERTERLLERANSELAQQK